MMILFIILALLYASFLLYLFMAMPRQRHPSELDALLKADYAHRGLHNIKEGIPENSMAAFARAKAGGFGIELDVHLSKDGKLIVEHDDTLLRTCGSPRRIEDSTYAELSDLHLEGTDQKLPLLEEVFALIDGAVPLLIEAKQVGNNAAPLADALVAALKNYQGPYCVESFDPRFLLAFRRRFPQAVRGQLSGALNKHGAKLAGILDFLMGHLLVCCLSRPDFIAYDHRDCRRPSFLFYRWLFQPPLFLWTAKNRAARAAVAEQKATPIFEITED